MKDLVVLTVLLERVNEETRVREIIREKLLSSQGDEKEKKPSFIFFFSLKRAIPYTHQQRYMPFAKKEPTIISKL